MRLFFALPLPDDVRRKLAALRADVGKARWTPEEQLHLTLRFVGEVEPETASELISCVEREVPTWPAVRFALRGVGTFGGIPRARVVWAAIDPPDAVRDVAASIERAVVSAGLEPETRPFRPHVTLARITRADTARLSAFVVKHASFETDAFGIDEVILYRSKLGPSGAVHEALHRFPLGHAGT